MFNIYELSKEYDSKADIKYPDFFFSCDIRLVAAFADLLDARKYMIMNKSETKVHRAGGIVWYDRIMRLLLTDDGGRATGEIIEEIANNGLLADVDGMEIIRARLAMDGGKVVI